MHKSYIYVSVFAGLLLVTMVIAVILLFSFLWATNVTNGSKLVINHDGGADDAMAIFIALIHEKYFDGPQVVAITTTFGNVDESQAFINTQKILGIANRREIPIYRGSRDPIIGGIKTDYYYGVDGLGNCDHDYEPIEQQTEHAVQALLDLSKTYEGNLTVVTLGPLTDIALAIKIDPEFITRLSMLYVGAGFIESPGFEDAEFNAAMDPESYYIITKYAHPNLVTVVPFTQIYSSMNMTKEWRNTYLGSIPTVMMEAQNCFERISLSNSTQWTELDPAVMAMALNSNIIEETRYSKNSIVLCGEKHGINTNEFTTADNANVDLVYSGNRELYQDFLITTFKAELNNT